MKNARKCTLTRADYIISRILELASCDIAREQLVAQEAIIHPNLSARATNSIVSLS